MTIFSMITCWESNRKCVDCFCSTKLRSNMASHFTWFRCLIIERKTKFVFDQNFGTSSFSFNHHHHYTHRHLPQGEPNQRAEPTNIENTANKMRNTFSRSAAWALTFCLLLRVVPSGNISLSAVWIFDASNLRRSADSFFSCCACCFCSCFHC